MKHMNIIIALIIIVIVIIVLLLIILSMANQKNIDMTNEQEEFYEEEEEIEYEIDNSLKEVYNKNTYYAVREILIKYMQYNSDLKLSKDKENCIIAISDMLDTNYKSKYNITNSRIEELAINYDITNGIYIEKMYVIEKSSRINIYYILGKCNEKNYELIIKTDSYNNTFSIFPEQYIQENNYDQSNIENVKINSEDIEIKEYNKFRYINISNQDMASNYYDNYIQILNDSIEKAYELLNEEYKNKRFPDIYNFENYINNGINKTTITIVSINKKEDFIEYKIKDIYDNVYIFKEKSFMNYTVELDDYTLESEAYKETYKNANSRDKGILNIDKFFKMINMQDYTSAYAVLDEQFKQNYFKTQAEFENYMKTKSFRYNKVEYKEYSNQISSLHTYKIQLIDATEESQNIIEFNIIIKLLEGTNFVMSFTV